jgi:hypothetical protein
MTLIVAEKEEPGQRRSQEKEVGVLIVMLKMLRPYPYKHLFRKMMILIGAEKGEQELRRSPGKRVEVQMGVNRNKKR